MSTPINKAISPIVLKVVQGDITAIETDAMVNSANTAMVFGGSKSVASRINELTGERLESILSNDDKYPKPVPLGQVCVTEGDVLPCKFVFHLSTHGNREEMRIAANELSIDEELSDRIQIALLETIQLGVENLVRECESLSLERMTIPLIGSGSLNLPKLLAIEVLVGTLSSKLLEKTPEYLREIKIVTQEQSSFDFINAFLESFEIDVSSENDSDLMMGNDQRSLISSKIGGKDISRIRRNVHYSGENFSENEPEIYENIAFDAVGEISSLKRKLRAVSNEKIRLEKENQKNIEQIRVLSERIEEFESKKNLGNFHNEDCEKAWQRSDLPLPLAYAQNILSAEEDPNGRLLNSIYAIGIVNKYFSSLVCAEYRAAGFFNERVNHKLKETFSKPVTDGSWHWIGWTIARAFKDENRNGEVIVDFVKQWLNEDGQWSRFSEVLKELTKLRNEIHDPLGEDKARAREWLDNFSPLWDEMCGLSESLLNYELVFINYIMLNLSDGRCRYAVKHLKGGVLVPQSGTIDLEDTYNPEELLLWDPMKGGILELSPFIVYEYSSMTNSRETYCLDLIQHTRFQFKAFRYALKYDMVFEDTNLFSNQQ